MLLTWMQLIDFYTLQRALDGLSEDEFAWKPHPGAWGVGAASGVHDTFSGRRARWRVGRRQ
jgi:hypothetical protein